MSWGLVLGLLALIFSVLTLFIHSIPISVPLILVCLAVVVGNRPIGQ